jgi:glycosyltransferase involved in cell wall biosynthesis
VRLGIYSDLVYQRDGETLSNNRAFIRFVTSLPPRVSELVLFGRLSPVPGRGPYVLPTEAVRVVGLPHYERATKIWSLLRAVRGSAGIFAAQCEHLDAVWIFGPQPMSMVFAWIARRRGVPLVLGVRHDYPQYIRNRLPSRWWLWAVPVAAGMDVAFRRSAKFAPTVALGDALARRYSRGAAVMRTGFSLVPRSELRSLDEALAVRWDGDRIVLSVGRLDREKNPLLLLDILAGLRAEDPCWRMVIAGDGPMREQMQLRIAELGLDDAVTMLGEVPNGPELWELYRRSQIFLHVSFTEGLPQVLLEAQAAGVPVVGTDVGGVAEALGDGTYGLLIPPADAAAAIEAVQRIAGDADLRRRLVSAALQHAAQETLEMQLDRLADFLQDAVETYGRGSAEGSRAFGPRSGRVHRRGWAEGRT